MSSESTLLQALEQLAQAFNDHDVDGVMRRFAPDCVMEMPQGPDACGRRYVGRDAVRQGVAERFAGLPDVHYADVVHVVVGSLGVSRWTVSGTRPDGTRVHNNGCDFYTFEGDLVVKKDSYWKNRQSLPPAPADTNTNTNTNADPGGGLKVDGPDPARS